MTDDKDDPAFFKPLYTIGVWENGKREKRFSVAVLMPSGTALTTHDHDIQVIKMLQCWRYLLCDLAL